MTLFEIKHYKHERQFDTEIVRLAVRAIISRDDKLLMIYSENVGDFKFPGGAIEASETDSDALIREVKEESGYTVNSSAEKVFQIREHSVSKESELSLFTMISDYYICSVDSVVGQQNLDDYEFELGFKAKWLTLGHAIKHNVDVFKNPQIDNPSWLEREILALTKIKERNII